MRCEGCGKDLPEDAAFCPECGKHTPAAQASRSAEEMIDLAQTGGLVRGWAAVQVPDRPEIPAAAEDAPQIPEPAPLPEATGMEIPGGGAASADIATGFLDKARIREEKRRAAQALVETAQVELREELAEIADREIIDEEARIQASVRRTESAYPREEAPPPPPAEERMWEETRERAEQHDVRGFVGDELPSTVEEAAGEAEEAGQSCCGYGCLALFVLLFLFFVIGFIINVVQ